MRGKRWVSGLVAVFVLTLALAGCGGKKEETKAAGAPEKAPVELLVWSHLTEPEVAEVDKLAQEWAKKTGNKVQVVVDQTGFQEFATAAQAGKAPDIMYGVPHDNLGTFQKAGLLTEVPAGVINKADYVPVSIDAVSYSGKMYAVPIGVESIALFYNKAMVKEVPKTWDEFIKVAKDKGFMYDIKNFYFSYGFLAGQGAYVFKNTGGGLDPKDVGLANDGAKAGLQLLSDLINKDKLMPIDVNYDMAKGKFAAGKQAFYLSGPWDVKSFQDAKIDFGVAPMPTLPNGKQFIPFLGVYSAFVGSGSKYQQESWDLIKYLRENDPVALFKTGTRYPANKKFQELPEVKADAIATGFGQSGAAGVPMPNIPAMSVVWDPAGKMVDLVISKKASPEQAATDALKAINEGVANLK